MVKSLISDWDSTAANNTDVGGIGIQGTSNVSNFDNALRELMAQVAAHHASDTIASAATCNIGAKEALALNVTGTTGISAFDTVKAGTHKVLRFSGAVTLTYNATSLILPGAADITTAAGDVLWMQSEGSGNWRCLAAFRADGTMLTSADISTAAQYRNDTAGKILTGAIVWDAAEPVTLSSSSNSIAFDLDAGINFELDDLAENTTLANASGSFRPGQSGFIRITQDATGGRTLAFGTDYLFAGGTAPTLTATADAEDVFFYTVLATDRILIAALQDIS